MRIARRAPGPARRAQSTWNRAWPPRAIVRHPSRAGGALDAPRTRCRTAPSLPAWAPQQDRRITRHPDRHYYLLCKRVPNTDDGYEFVTRFEIISGERDQVRRKVYYRGDSQVAWRSRLWPPPRVQRCDSCLNHFGTYVPTCDRKDNEPCTRKGRLIMVLNNDLNLAVACTIRCAGHSGGPRRLQRHNFCGVENLPDLFVYR